MPMSTTPHKAVLPWLVAIAGTFAVHVGAPEPPAPAECVAAVDEAPASVEHVIAKEDFDRLRADARQHATATAEGLWLRDVRPGSLFAELGFESGDLVVDISGGDATRFRVLRGDARRSFEIVLRIG
jgi:hypothetical protein